MDVSEMIPPFWPTLMALIGFVMLARYPHDGPNRRLLTGIVVMAFLGVFSLDTWKTRHSQAFSQDLLRVELEGCQARLKKAQDSIAGVSHAPEPVQGN